MSRKKVLTHFDSAGNAHMVDVGAKDVTERVAVAGATIRMQPATLRLIRDKKAKKGDVLAVARVAAIQAAKRTSDMIPLCHPLYISGVTVDFVVGNSSVEIEVAVETVDRTGVEMEALHACSVAALTIYDMCKAVDRGMVMGNVKLLEKHGGKSGSFTAD